jgi:3-phenylpropionate/trans-cinnamate dioxygenase ferredoxin component
MSDWMTVARVGEIAPGEFLAVDIDDARVVVVNVEGEYYAIEDLCTHDGGQFDGGVLEGSEIICPRHGARFCVKTGKAVAGPAYDPTASFPVRVVDGEIQVRDDRWD